MYQHPSPQKKGKKDAEMLLLFPCYLFSVFQGLAIKFAFPRSFLLLSRTYQGRTTVFLLFLFFTPLRLWDRRGGGGGQRCFFVAASRFIFPNVHPSTQAAFLILPSFSSSPPPPMLNVFFLCGGGGNTFASFQHFPQQKM